MMTSKRLLAYHTDSLLTINIQTLGAIRRNLTKSPTHIKAVAKYTVGKSNVIIFLCRMGPTQLKLFKKKTLERIQRQAARFCKNNYSGEPGSVTTLLQELGWETLQTRRKYKRITTLYKMEHNIVDIPLDQYIKHNTRCSLKQLPVS